MMRVQRHKTPLRFAPLMIQLDMRKRSPQASSAGSTPRTTRTAHQTIAALGTDAEFAPSREWLVARIAEEARPGDLVLVMGARDPSLTELARAILAAIEAEVAAPAE